MYDIAILNGTLMDPKKYQSTVGNIGIKDGKIAVITRESIEALETLDATGKIVCPGIIDTHGHVEGNDDCAEVLAAMGVTTVYNGNCGHSVDDLKGFYEKYETQGFLINQLEQVGHTTLRQQAGIMDRYVPATEEQIEVMKALVEDAFSIGVSGISFGLEYVPGSSKKEVLELSKIAAKYGKLVTIHTRTDCYTGLAALKEAIDICKKTGASVHVSHLVYMYGVGMATESLLMIAEARKEGYDITADTGLYSAFATDIGSAVFDDGCLDKWGVDVNSIVAGTGKYRGQRLTHETMAELRKDFPEDTAIAFVGREYEIYELLEPDYMMVSTDAGTLYENGLPGHPQDAGTYPKFFKEMVRQQNRMTFLEAIKRCTYLPALRFNLPQKGCLEVGADGDILVFDPALIEDTAQYPCFGETQTRPNGIEYVLVNGKIVVCKKQVLPIKPGKIISHTNKLWEWQ